MKRTAAKGMKKNRGSVLVLAMVFMVMIMFLAGVFLQLTTVNIKSVVREAERIKASWIARAGISQQIHDLRGYYNLYQYRVSKDVAFGGGQYSIGSMALIGRGFHYSLIASVGEYPVSTSTVTDSMTARFAETARLEMNATTDFAQFMDLGNGTKSFYRTNINGPLHVNGNALIGKMYGASSFFKESSIFGPVIDCSQRINIKDGDPTSSWVGSDSHVLFAEGDTPDPFDVYYNYAVYSKTPEAWPHFSRVFFEAKGHSFWSDGPYDAKKYPCTVTKTADDGSTYSYNLLTDSSNGGKFINVPTMANITYKYFAHLITADWTMNWQHPLGKVTNITNYEIKVVPGQTDALPNKGLQTLHWWGPALNLGPVLFQADGFSYDIPSDRDLAYINVAMLRYDSWPNIPNLPIGYGQNSLYQGTDKTDLVNHPGDPVDPTNLPPTCINIDYPSKKLKITYPVVWGWWRFDTKPADTGQKWRGRRYTWAVLNLKSSNPGAPNGYAVDRVVDNATDQVFTLRGDVAANMPLDSTGLASVYNLTKPMSFSFSNNPPNDGTYPNTPSIPDYAVSPTDPWQDYNKKNLVRVRFVFGGFNGVKGYSSDPLYLAAQFTDEWRVVPVTPLGGANITVTGESDPNVSLTSVDTNGAAIFNQFSAVAGCDFSTGDIVFAKMVGGSQRGAKPGKWDVHSGSTVSGGTAWPYVANATLGYVRVEALWSHDFPTNLSVWLHDTQKVIKYDLSNVNEDNCPRPQVIGDLNDPIEKQKYGIIYCQVPVALYGVPKVPVTIFCEDDVYLGAINQSYLDNDQFWDTRKLHVFPTKYEDDAYQPVAVISKGVVYTDYTLAPQYETPNYDQTKISCNYYVGTDPKYDYNPDVFGHVNKRYYPKKLAVYHSLWSTDYFGDDDIQLGGSLGCFGRGYSNLITDPTAMYQPSPRYYGSHYRSLDSNLYSTHKYLNRMAPQAASTKFNARLENSGTYAKVYNNSFRTNPPPHAPNMVSIVSHNIMYDHASTQAFIENLQAALNTQDGTPDYSDQKFVATLHDLLSSLGE